ncbi:MAG: YeeE/YedE thiosulfate transporter family protein, partial [Niameybacter sp.]|uniref:YeeE/YedE thiosulfate transporter family protein n=1 Tax=Niameybacter sp. TaxID=2033640 RepID=UPI002FC5E74E
MNVASGIVLGGLFGAALYYVGASNPQKLLSMLRFQNLRLMKIIFFAIGFGSTLLAVTSLLGLFDITHLSIKETHLGVLVGGLIFGLGFGGLGTCPGTCVVATTSGGFKKAIVALLGGLLGAWVFSMSYSWFKEKGLFDAMNLGRLTWFQVSEAFQAVFEVGYVGLLGVGVLFMVIASILPRHPFKKNG